jgi:uncharacterized protein YigE (DUF2233 family)
LNHKQGSAKTLFTGSPPGSVSQFLKGSFLFSMMRLFRLILFVIILFSPAILGAEKSPSAVVPWKVLATGLSFARWPGQAPIGKDISLAILRIDPEQWSFKVFYNKELKSIDDWQQSTGASVICNGGYYQENYAPAGRILVNGASYGPYKNSNMKAMFLAEPKKGLKQLPKATIIDLKDPDSDAMISFYEQGIQSFPVLLDPKGQVRVNPSSFQASRTVIAQDQSGIMYLLVTEKSAFTLFDLGNYLKALPLNLRFALNLDGGSRTQLSVRVGPNHFRFSGQSETSQTTRFFFPEPIKLPSVIGLFPRVPH